VWYQKVNILRTLCHTRVAVGLVGIGSCTLALERQSGQCRTHSDCQLLDPAYVCGNSGVCVALASESPEPSEPRGDECNRDMDCSGPAVPSVCRAGYCRAIAGPDGRCTVLGAPDASFAEDEDVMLIGLLTTREELEPTGPIVLGRPERPRGVPGAVSTAIAELNQVRLVADAAVPPLVAVVCDEADIASIEYLLDALQVHVIVGPTSPERVELVLVRSLGDALLLPPYADGPNLVPRPSDSDGFLVSCRPNRLGVLPYLLDAIAEAKALITVLGAPENAAAINPALVVSSDVATAGFADGLDDMALAAAGVRRIRYNTDLPERRLAPALGAAEPPVNLVVAASAEDDWAANMEQYDAAHFVAEGTYPYYLLADKRSEVYQPPDAKASGDGPFPPQSSRLLGLDYHRSARSLLARADFVTAFDANVQFKPDAALEYAYDCTYVVVYAAIAAALRLRRPVVGLRPEAILTGLSALQGAGPALAVGRGDALSVISNLVSNAGMDGSLDLFGASGELDFSLTNAGGGAPVSAASRKYFSVTAPGGELYCVDARIRELCDTGIVFPAGGGPPSRLGNPCACLGSE
jgi:hypothetical protein